ncbi:potassium channel family protein [Paracoccus albus]|uniref:potassium channel family protein n=1 Tax=Paracoccus albus TaxID=3017784 RepID=UPI0022F047F9|nr:potassium channel family protein [Paracoccus albus]WBU62025.1 potassium channel family protein [Paracoccus albus]
MLRLLRHIAGGIGDIFSGIRAAFASRQVRFLIALTGLLIAGASVFYHWVEGWGWIDAIYFSVITISTVGYGDFAPQTAIGKLFTSGYVLCGLGLFVTTATAIGDSIVRRADHRTDKE